MAVRCVVFDVDDTLYLERDYARSGFAAVAEWARMELGIPDFSERAWALFEAGRRRDVFDAALREAGLDAHPSRIAAMVARYRAHDPHIALLPDARLCLDRLRGKVALAGVTDGPALAQRAKVRALGLERWLEPVIFTAELGAAFGKPHPRAFQLVETATGCAGRDCLYVADNPAKDFAGPAALGWRTIRVRRPGGLHAGVQSGADVEAEAPDLARVADLMGLPP